MCAFFPDSHAICAPAVRSKYLARKRLAAEGDGGVAAAVADMADGGDSLAAVVVAPACLAPPGAAAAAVAAANEEEEGEGEEKAEKAPGLRRSLSSPSPATPPRAAARGVHRAAAAAGLSRGRGRA